MLYWETIELENHDMSCHLVDNSDVGNVISTSLQLMRRLVWTSGVILVIRSSCHDRIKGE